jgi:hypothetical protein
MKRLLKRYIKNFLWKNFNNLLLNCCFLPLTVQIVFYLMKEKSSKIQLKFYHHIYFNDKILIEGVDSVKKIRRNLMAYLLIDLDLMLEQFISILCYLMRTSKIRDMKFGDDDLKFEFIFKCGCFK